MFKYSLRRILEGIPTIMIIITVSFFLMRLAPGSPFTTDRAYPPEILANIEAKYHLNEPLWKQFLLYLGDLLKGDLGPSFKYKDFTVNQLLAQSFVASFKLGIIAFFVSVVIGIACGMVAALYQNTIIDYGTISLLIVTSIVPTIVAAPLLIYVMSVKLQLLPSGGWNGGELKYMIMPLIMYIYGSMTFLARITRANMVEVLHSNFIRTAKAKGLSTKYILVQHALRAASIPVIQILTFTFLGFISGALIIEQIFGIPGLGQLYISGAQNRDYSVVMSITMLSGVLIIVANIVNDIILAAMDPRIRF